MRYLRSVFSVISLRFDISSFVPCEIDFGVHLLGLVNSLLAKGRLGSSESSEYSESLSWKLSINLSLRVNLSNEVCIESAGTLLMEGTKERPRLRVCLSVSVSVQFDRLRILSCVLCTSLG